MRGRVSAGQRGDHIPTKEVQLLIPVYDSEARQDIDFGNTRKGDTIRMTTRTTRPQTLTKQQGQHMTIIEARDAYIAYLQTRRKKYSDVTLDNYHGTITRLAREIGDIRLMNLRPEHIENWFYGPGGLMDTHTTGSARTYYKDRQGISESTHNQYLVRIKAFFDWCTAKGYLRKDLLVDIEAMEVPETHRQRPKPQILVNLLDHARNPRDRAYVAVAINLAMRTRDLMRLRVGDVDLESGYVRTYINKSKKADHKIITTHLDAELRRWFVFYAEVIGRPLEPSDALFPSMTGSMFAESFTRIVDGKPQRVRTRTGTTYHPDWPITRATEIVKHCLREAGLETYYEGTHTLRRAAARAYFDWAAQQSESKAGVMRQTQKFLNHTSSRTTEIYLGTDMDKEALDDSLRGRSFLPTLDDNVIPLRRAEGE